MRLDEDYGESEELNTFVYQATRRFSTYYMVTLDLGRDASRKYFAYEEAARKYFDGLMNEAKNNSIYYNKANIQLTKVTVELDYDDLEDEVIYSDDEVEEDDDFSITDFSDIDSLYDINDNDSEE